MRNLIFCLFLIGGMSIGHSQIVLKEAKVDYNRASMQVDPVTKSVQLEIPETYVGEFQEDPLSFIQENFSIQQLVEANRKFKFDSYDVYFTSRKGKVLAKFDKNGELISSYHRFKNVELPEDVKMQILQNYKNSKVVNNRHILSTRNLLIDKEFYKVKIQDGNKTKRLRIERNTQGYSLVGL